MQARIPSSSSNSRAKACSLLSPGSILPPGNSHLSAIGCCGPRWQMSSWPPRRISAATTRRGDGPGCGGCFALAESIASSLGGILFDSKLRCKGVPRKPTETRAALGWFPQNRSAHPGASKPASLRLRPVPLGPGWD